MAEIDQVVLLIQRFHFDVIRQGVRNLALVGIQFSLRMLASLLIGFLTADNRNLIDFFIPFYIGNR